MGIISTGIASIAFGVIAVDGGMSTDLEALGYTLEGTAKINTDDGTETEFMVEETDTAIDTDQTEGKMTVQLTIADPDEDTLVEVLGGTKTGTGASAIFSYPNPLPVIERSIVITPKKGMGLKIPRAKIKAKFSSDIGRGKLMGLEITGTILQPTKANERKFTTFRV